jgi:hypothetical protein
MHGYPFYNETIKQAVAVFGSLFNNITIRRRDGKVLPVPIAYGPRSKWLEAQKGLDKEEEMFEKLLPRMSYEVVAMNYDQMRKLTNAQKITGVNNSSNQDVRQRISSPVPYNLDFSLYVQTKNLNDGWQIIEQILPFFTPAYTVRVRNFPADRDSDTPIMENAYDIPFTLLAVTWADDWTGDISDRRTIEWTLEFQTKVWMTGPAATTSVIYDSRAILSTPPNGVDIHTMTRASDQTGIEVGYAALDSEQPVFENNDFISPNIINTTDSDGNIVKIIRAIDEI